MLTHDDIQRRCKNLRVQLADVIEKSRFFRQLRTTELANREMAKWVPAIERMLKYDPANVNRAYESFRIYAMTTLNSFVKSMHAEAEATRNGHVETLLTTADLPF